MSSRLRRTVAAVLAGAVVLVAAVTGGFISQLTAGAGQSAPGDRDAAAVIDQPAVVTNAAVVDNAAVLSTAKASTPANRCAARTTATVPANPRLTAWGRWALDADAFVAGGKLFMVYRDDAVTSGVETGISGVQLDGEGRAIWNTRHTLATSRDISWDTKNISGGLTSSRIRRWPTSAVRIDCSSPATPRTPRAMPSAWRIAGRPRSTTSAPSPARPADLGSGTRRADSGPCTRCRATIQDPVGCRCSRSPPGPPRSSGTGIAAAPAPPSPAV